MHLTDLSFTQQGSPDGLTETRMEIVATVTETEECEFIQSLTQNLRGRISLRQLLAILVEHEEREGPTSPPAPPRILVTVQTPGAQNLAQQVVIEHSVKQQMTIEYVNVLNGQMIPVHLPLAITAQVVT